MEQECQPERGDRQLSLGRSENSLGLEEPLKVTCATPAMGRGTFHEITLLQPDPEYFTRIDHLASKCLWE